MSAYRSPRNPSRALQECHLPAPRDAVLEKCGPGMAAKLRPALVLSIPVLDHERHLDGIVPHTTHPWSTRFEAVIKLPWLKAGAFDAQGFRPVPLVAFQWRLGTLSGAQLALVEDAVLRWIGVNRPSA